MKKKKRPPTVNVATQEFRAKHGFQPRGLARWTFYFSDAPSVPWCDAFVLTYTEAKQRAVVEAKRRNLTAVRVDPDPEGLQLYEE